MDDNLRKIFEKWDEFKDTHTKLYLPERKEAILELYQRLQLELQEEATFTLEDQETFFTITITADSFLASDHSPVLRDLIHTANTFRANIQDGKIVLDLWFMCWDWIPRA